MTNRRLKAFLLALCLCLVAAPSLYAQKKAAPRPLSGAPTRELPAYTSLDAFARTLTGGSLRAAASYGGRVERVPAGPGFWQTLRPAGAAKSGAPWSDALRMQWAENGTVRWMQGRLGATGLGAGKTAGAAQLADAALAVLASYAPVLGLKEPRQELRLTQADADELGYTHVRFEQAYQGVPVWGRDVVVHLDGTGEVYAFNGTYEPTPAGVDTRPRLAASDAERVAVSDLKAKGEWVELAPEKAAWLGLEGPASALVLLPTPQGMRLAYEVTLHANLVERYAYLVDAATGTVLKRVARYCTLVHDPGVGARVRMDAPAPRAAAPAAAGAPAARAAGSFLDASAVDLNGRNQSFRVYRDADGTHFAIWDFPNMGTFTLPKLPEVGGAITISAENHHNLDNAVFVTSRDNAWMDASSVSAHVNMSVAYNYYNKTFGRHAINDKDESMLSVIHLTEEGGAGLENAFWNGRFMGYGDGAEVFKSLAGGLDVAGHEMTHGVVEHTANLIYEFQPGALNESFADVFGAMVDRDDFLMGEDIMRDGSDALRDLENPDNGRVRADQPAHMRDYRELTLEQDNGGVHINSGIPNRAAVLVIKAIGHDKTEQIYYRALSKYMTRNSQFGDARLALEQAATDLYGAGSAELSAVRQAYDAVGIGGDTQGGGGNDEGNEVDPIEGQELIAYVYADGRIGVVDVATGETSVLEGALANPASQLSTDALGRYLYFISADFQLWYVELATGEMFYFPELYIQQPGDLWNVVVAPGDNYVVLSSAYENDPKLYVSDFRDIAQVELKVQTTQAGVFDRSIVYPDALSLSPNAAQPRVAFDALRRVAAGGAEVEFWSMFEMDMQTEKLFNLMAAQPEAVSVGNITYSSTDPDVVAFNIVEHETQETSIAIASLGEGKLTVLDLSQAAYAPMRPSFSPDDRFIAFTDEAQNALLFVDGSGEVRGMAFEEPVHNPKWFAIAAGGTANEQDELPDGVTLDPAYPNPFNPSTALTYRVAQAGAVRVEVFNLLGQRVATLVDEVKAAGEHRVTWRADGQPSGVYVVKLQAGAVSRTQQVVLMK